jgi:predicted Zn-dependent protease
MDQDLKTPPPTMDRIARFALLLQQQPGNDLFRFSLAQALLAADRALEAEPHLRQCAATKADWMMPRILLGKLLLRSGRTDEARGYLEEALNLAIAQSHEAPEAELRALLEELGRSAS